jgi:hypothetical protein
MILINETVHYEPGKVIKCDFKSGSVERSKKLVYKEGIPPL